jgi:flagellar basal body-associated protein FliL
MAEENQDQETNKQPAKSGGGGGMLPALLIIALMPVISFAMFKFVFLPELKKITPEEGEAAHQMPIDPKKFHVESGVTYRVPFPERIVNLKGVSLLRYFRTEFEIESSNPDIESEVNVNMAAMKDLADTILGNLTLADLEQTGIKNVVRNQLKQGFDKILQPPMVDEIYFSNWVVQ